MAILLQEDGSDLWQETGDHILLDEIAPVTTATMGVKLAGIRQGVAFRWPGDTVMTNKLGPMSTPGIVDFWVSIDFGLEPAETLSSPVVTTDNADLEASLTQVVSVQFTDSQRKIVPADRAIVFRLTAAAEIDADVNLTVDWETSSNEEQSGTVVVECVPKHTEFI